ncbi:hypothetical protein DFQ26_008396 [Actinomortierella ambigua]|nr:hypothetical protein DFQ26_008396 [Actinomortierella ambigua]
MQTEMVENCIDALREQIGICSSYLTTQRRSVFGGGGGGGRECDAHNVVLYPLTFLDGLSVRLSCFKNKNKENGAKVEELASCASIVVANEGLSGSACASSPPPDLEGIHELLEEQANDVLILVVNDPEKEEERTRLSR